MTIAAHLIRAARTATGQSQRALSAKARTSGATIAAYESGTKDPRTETLARILAAAGCEMTVRQRRSRNELFVDLMCERLAEAVLNDPGQLARARDVLEQMDSAWAGAWRDLLDAGVAPVVAVLTSPHPAARPLKADTPFAVMGLMHEEERQDLLRRAWGLRNAA